MAVRRRVIGAALAFTTLAVAPWWSYHRWLARVTRRSSQDSAIAMTALGPVEYSDHGEGPVVLQFHGGNVGHNGWFFLDHLVDKGFRVITPDRPGYLGTPLGEDGSPARQADLAAALLDSIECDRAAVVGLSAGGPSAIEFAARHADRTAALVLLSAISQRTGLSDEQMSSTLGRLVMTPKYQDVAYFLIHRAMHAMPALALQDFVRTETTYDMETGKRYIRMVMQDPAQRRQVLAMADAMVPARPRFAGVMNDLEVQQNLGDLPFDAVRAPALIVGSRHDGDIGYDNSLNAHRHLPGSELITVDQFGHLIWWGDASVTRDFQNRIENFLDAHLRQPDPAR